MWSVDKKGNITMTKGDTPSFTITPMIESNGEYIPYEPTDDDSFVFAMKLKGSNTVALQKQISAETLKFSLAINDTKNLALGTYNYEVSLLRGTTYSDTFITGKTLTLTEEVC